MLASKVSVMYEMLMQRALDSLKVPHFTGAGKFALTNQVRRLIKRFQEPELQGLTRDLAIARLSMTSNLPSVFFTINFHC